MQTIKMRSLLWMLLIVPVLSNKSTKKLTSGCFSKCNNITREINVKCVDSSNLWDTDQLCTSAHNNETQFLMSIVFRRSDFGNMDSLSWINSDTERIASLDLSNNQFNNQPTLDSMPNLKKLNISHNLLNVAKLSNQITYSHLHTIDYSYNKIMKIELNIKHNIYANLKTLDLSHNLIDVVPEGIFNGFNYLEHLNLSFNHLMDLNLMTFSGAENLRSLDLGYNHIAVINSSLLRLAELQQLSLRNNFIDHISYDDFKNLSNVIKLDLSSNYISLFSYSTFHVMSSLKCLDLSDNILDNIEKESFVKTVHLDTIYLSDNNLKNIPNELFESRNISQITLNNNILEGNLSRGMFSGLNGINKLEISHQNLVSIEDFAFYGLNKLEILLLNNNNINNMSNNSFKLLNNVKQIDLSYNNIMDFEVDKSDLLNLRSISLKNNLISIFNENYFKDLDNLQVLDISHNFILKIEINTFKKLNMLTEVAISSSLSDFSNVFESKILTDIDASFSELPEVSNYSFNNMNRLRNINMSHCEIERLGYKTFSGTGNITQLDLSFNKLTKFIVKSTDLMQLKTLMLNNNNLSDIKFISFDKLYNLLYLNLSYNNLLTIYDNTFMDLISLRSLDLSYNVDIDNFDFFTNLHYLYNLNDLNISGLQFDLLTNNLTFGSENKCPLSELVVSNARLENPNKLDIGKLKHLINLVLSYNDIIYINKDFLSNVYRIQEIDLSYNRIEYIQPGALKNKVHLKTLNLSHNFLTGFKYGAFRGLIRLNVLDLSYNRIVHYQKEILEEAEHLNVLILDNNRILHINYSEFSKTSISKLSIGNNSIPCKELSSLILVDYVDVVAQNVDDYEENVNGIICGTK